MSVLNSVRQIRVNPSAKVAVFRPRLYTRARANTHCRYWSAEEHERFLQGLKIHGYCRCSQLNGI